MCAAVKGSVPEGRGSPGRLGAKPTGGLRARGQASQGDGAQEEPERRASAPCRDRRLVSALGPPPVGTGARGPAGGSRGFSSAQAVLSCDFSSGGHVPSGASHPLVWEPPSMPPAVIRVALSF